MSLATWTKTSKGEFSTSKIWRHIAFAVATYVVIWAPTMSWELLLVYLAVVSGSEIAKRVLEARTGITKQEVPK